MIKLKSRMNDGTDAELMVRKEPGDNIGIGIIYMSKEGVCRIGVRLNRKDMQDLIKYLDEYGYSDVA